MSRVDARLLEMQFLAKLDRDGKTDFSAPYDASPHRQMIASLLYDGYVNDGFDNFMELQRWQSMLAGLDAARGNSIKALLGGRGLTLKISHKGRVRLSELEQQLQTGRDRDDTGLLWAKRHLATGLAIDVLSASKETPLSVAFLDMNGLGAINNTHGHPAGDEAIRAFFQAVVATLGERGEAYRNGGDEVVVILRATADEDARKLLDVFLRQLGKDVLVLGDARLTLTASCGSASTTDPNEDAAVLLKRADAVQYRAKDESKKHDPRVSAWAVGDGGVVTFPAGEGRAT